MDNSSTKLSNLNKHIFLLRNFVFVFLILALVLVLPTIFIPKVLSGTLKILLLSVISCAVVFIGFALFLSKNDSTATLFFTLLSGVSAGTLLGVGLTALDGLVSK